MRRPGEDIILYHIRRMLMMLDDDYSEEEDITLRAKIVENRKQQERERHNSWYRNSKMKAFEVKRRYELYPKLRLSSSMSSSMRRSLKTGKNGMHWESLIPYTLDDLVAHLENLFQPGMTWDNYGKWHIDHKRPISSFNFSNWFDIEFQECWALENLQPLWRMENISKGAKWDG